MLRIVALGHASWLDVDLVYFNRIQKRLIGYKLIFGENYNDNIHFCMRVCVCVCFGLNKTKTKPMIKNSKQSKHLPRKYW